MKSIRLPETDIANLAFKSADFKIAFLSNWLKPKRIKGSYEPLRRSVGEAANVGLPLLPEIRSTTLEQLENLVTKACRGNGDLVSMNIAPVRAIRAFVIDNNAEASFLDDLPIALYPGMRYSFWAPMIVRYNGKSRVPIFDLRRTGGLSESGLRVSFAIMHDRLRVLNPDYADVQFEAWRFANNSSRSIRAISEWNEPIGYKEIVADVAETYALLNALRSGDSDRRGDPDYGPLFR